MRTVRLDQLSVDELVELYMHYALEQDVAELSFDNAKANPLFWKLEHVEAELKSRSGDQRHALLPLLNHSNPQVQVKVAKATLAIAPVAARAVLEDIAKNCYGPQKLEAGMSLRNLDAGIFKPT